MPKRVGERVDRSAEMLFEHLFATPEIRFGSRQGHDVEREVIVPVRADLDWAIRDVGELLPCQPVSVRAARLRSVGKVPRGHECSSDHRSLRKQGCDRVGQICVAIVKGQHDVSVDGFAGAAQAGELGDGDRVQPP